MKEKQKRRLTKACKVKTEMKRMQATWVHSFGLAYNVLN